MKKNANLFSVFPGKEWEELHPLLYSKSSQFVIYQISTEQPFHKGGTDKLCLSVVPQCNIT